MHKVIEDSLSRRAVVHLLKNGGEVNEEIEDPEKLAQRLATKREEIQRLEAQLAGRLPKGRDPTGEQANNFLQEAIQPPEHPSCYPELFLFDIFYHYALLPMPSLQYALYLLQTILIESKVVESEFLAWQEAMAERLTNAAKIPNSLLYPLIFGGTDDLYWSFESKETNQHDSELGQPCEGTKSSKRPSKRKRKQLRTRSEERICVRFKGLGDYTFKLYCDRRQLPIFQLFTTDWLAHKKLDKEKKYSLGLFASRELENELTKKRRKILSYETSLVQLSNSPPRPSKVPYQGEANITLGISFCRQELVGVAVVDLQTQQVLEYYSLRKLLTNQRVKKSRRDRSLLQLQLEKYRLVNRLRKLRRRNLVHRQEEQEQGRCVESKAESNLGQYLERVIAAKIAQIALEWKASSVVIPNLGDMREYIESAVQARAKQLFPNHRERQKSYAKQFRIEGHRWSCRRLTEFIRSRTLSEGISIKAGRQPATGSLANKALKIALSGHNFV